MAIFRTEKNSNYTVMSNYHFREKNMSLKAKGLLSFMLSLPDDWDYSMAGLVSLCKENETAIKSALKELQDFGYVRIDKIYPDKSNTGRIEYVYNVFEKPVKNEKQDIEKQDVENLCVENQCVENHRQLNTKKQNTKITNNISKDIYIKKDICENFKNEKDFKKPAIKKSKTKKEKRLEYIERKCIEYDLQNDVIELIIKFFDNLLTNGKMVTNDKIDATLNNIAKVNHDKQIKAVQLSLDKGYMNIDPEWLNSCTSYNSNKVQSYRTRKTNITVEENERNRQKFAEDVKSGKALRF